MIFYMQQKINIEPSVSVSLSVPLRVRLVPVKLEAGEISCKTFGSKINLQRLYLGKEIFALYGD